MAYVACKRLKIGHGFREIGELVPEAETWRNLRVYLDNGSVAVVPNAGTVAEGPPKEKSIKPRAAMAKPKAEEKKPKAKAKTQKKKPEEKEKKTGFLGRLKGGGE